MSEKKEAPNKDLMERAHKNPELFHKNKDPYMKPASVQTGEMDDVEQPYPGTAQASDHHEDSQQAGSTNNPQLTTPAANSGQQTSSVNNPQLSTYAAEIGQQAGSLNNPQRSSIAEGSEPGPVQSCYGGSNDRTEAHSPELQPAEPSSLQHDHTEAQEETQTAHAELKEQPQTDTNNEEAHPASAPTEAQNHPNTSHMGSLGNQQGEAAAWLPSPPGRPGCLGVGKDPGARSPPKQFRNNPEEYARALSSPTVTNDSSADERSVGRRGMPNIPRTSTYGIASLGSSLDAPFIPHVRRNPPPIRAKCKVMTVKSPTGQEEQAEGSMTTGLPYLDWSSVQTSRSSSMQQQRPGRNSHSLQSSTMGTSDARRYLDFSQPGTSDARRYLDFSQPGTSDARRHVDFSQPGTSDARRHLYVNQPGTSDARRYLDFNQPETSDDRRRPVFPKVLKPKASKPSTLTSGSELSLNLNLNTGLSSNPHMQSLQVKPSDEADVSMHSNMEEEETKSGKSQVKLIQAPGRISEFERRSRSPNPPFSAEWSLSSTSQLPGSQLPPRRPQDDSDSNSSSEVPKPSRRRHPSKRTQSGTRDSQMASSTQQGNIPSNESNPCSSENTETVSEPGSHCENVDSDNNELGSEFLKAITLRSESENQSTGNSDERLELEAPHSKSGVSEASHALSAQASDDGDGQILSSNSTSTGSHQEGDSSSRKTDSQDLNPRKRKPSSQNGGASSSKTNSQDSNPRKRKPSPQKCHSDKSNEKI